MKKLNYLILVLIAVSALQCTLFKKEIKKPVIVKIVAPETYTNLTGNVNYTKYINNHTQSEYQGKFMENLISEGKITHNITIDNEAASPDYLLEIKVLTLNESDFTQTVSDPKSPYNGQTFLLNKIDVACDIRVLDAKTNKQIGFSCTNSKIRQEKINNNRNLVDLVSGSNKDHKTYREKTLSDNIALQLSGDVGRRVWVPITKRIRKSLK